MFLAVFVLFPAYKRRDGDDLKVSLEFTSFLNSSFMECEKVLYIIIPKVLEMQKVRTGFRNKDLNRNLLLTKCQ